MEIDRMNGLAYTCSKESEVLGRGDQPQQFKIHEPWLRLAIENSRNHWTDFVGINPEARREALDLLDDMELQLLGHASVSGLVEGCEAYLREYFKDS